MLGFTALSRTLPARSLSGVPAPVAASRSAAALRHLEVHRSVVPGEAWGGESAGCGFGREVLFAVVRQGEAGVLEVTSLLLDEEGFGTMRFRLVADADEVVAELRGLARRGARLVLAHDGGRTSCGVVAALRDLAERVAHVGRLVADGDRWGLRGGAVEEQAWRSTLVREFREGRSAAGLALLELGEADVFALRQELAREQVADVSGVSARCGWFRTLERR